MKDAIMTKRRVSAGEKAAVVTKIPAGRVEKIFKMFEAYIIMGKFMVN